MRNTFYDAEVKTSAIKQHKNEGTHEISQYYHKGF